MAVYHIALLDNNYDELYYFKGYERVSANFNIENIHNGYNGCRLVSSDDIIFRFGYLPPCQTARVNGIGIVDNDGNRLYAIEVGVHSDGYHLSGNDTLRYNKGNLIICLL